MTSHAELFTAGLGWVWLGVTETWTTLAASPCALVGATIMVGGAVADGLFGDVLAFGMTVSMAIMMLIIREHRRGACLARQ
jgi:drug/metabolite transporter (DMT)-like permease